MILWGLLGCIGQSNHETAAIDGCYYRSKIYELMMASTFDPLEVRWAGGVDEVCRLTNGELRLSLKGAETRRCATAGSCPELNAELFAAEPPEQLSVLVSEDSAWTWSAQSFQQRTADADDAWAIEYLAKHGGQVTADDGVELSLISPAQIFIAGQAAELKLIKCLVMRDIHPPHQTLCLFEASGQGYAHVGDWVAVRRAGTSGLDARRAYALNGGSQSYLSSQTEAIK